MGRQMRVKAIQIHVARFLALWSQVVGMVEAKYAAPTVFVLGWGGCPELGGQAALGVHGKIRVNNLLTSHGSWTITQSEVTWCTAQHKRTPNWQEILKPLFLGTGWPFLPC